MSLLAYMKAQGDGLLGGEPVEVILAEWQATGLSDDLIEAYIEAGTFRASAAAAMHAEGITPEQAAEKVAFGGQLNSRGYWFSNGDL